MEDETYLSIVKSCTPKKRGIKNFFLAFIGGGMISLLCELLINVYQTYLNFTYDNSAILSVISICVLSFLLTIFGLYNNLSQIFKAGLFIPTTGFVNSMTSAAIEGRFEGPVLGVGSRLFSLAGSVVAYGTVSSFFVVLIRYILSLFGVNI